MRTINYVSKTHGKFTVIIDDDDFGRVSDSGKWCVVIKRGRPYFQKRVDYTPETRGRIVELHRWIMGEPKGKYIDHINNNTLDNRKCNLRACSNAANLRNGRVRDNNTSGVTGVRQVVTGRWEARIRVNYKIIFLGLFDTFEEACEARKNAEIKYFDE